MSDKKLNIFIGIPGSGKSYHAYQFYHSCIYINADTLRAVFCGDVSDQSKNHVVFQTLEKMVEYFMKLESSIVIDNCNQTRDRRKYWVSLAKKYGYRVNAIVMKTSYEECILRNSKRDRKVPEFVLEKMNKEFQEPTKEEGFDDIKYV